MKVCCPSYQSLGFMFRDLWIIVWCVYCWTLVLLSVCWVRVHGKKVELFYNRGHWIAGILTTADGNELTVLGETEVRIRMGKIECSWPVIIVQGLAHDFVLGSDFFQHYQCQIRDLWDRYCSFPSSAKGKTGSCSSGQLLRQSCQITIRSPCCWIPSCQRCK